MTYHRKTFFDAIRPLFGGRLTKSQVEGMNALFKVWEARYANFEPAVLAYCMATSFHETGKAMQPVREAFAGSDTTAIARLDKAHRQGRMPYVRHIYWRPDANGRAWFGRGHVQLTHKDNYHKAAARLGLPLDSRPELALDPEISARVLYSGCIDGWFTQHKLTDFISQRRIDFCNARKVVNPGDHKTYKMIEGYAHQFHGALNKAATTTRQPVPAVHRRAGKIGGCIGVGAGVLIAAQSMLWPHILPVLAGAMLCIVAVMTWKVLSR